MCDIIRFLISKDVLCHTYVECNTIQIHKDLPTIHYQIYDTVSYFIHRQRNDHRICMIPRHLLFILTLLCDNLIITVSYQTKTTSIILYKTRCYTVKKKKGTVDYLIHFQHIMVHYDKNPSFESLKKKIRKNRLPSVTVMDLNSIPAGGIN